MRQGAREETKRVILRSHVHSLLEGEGMRRGASDGVSSGAAFDGARRGVEEKLLRLH